MAPSSSAFNVRQRLGQIRRGDAEAAKELDRARDAALLQQGSSRSKKVCVWGGDVGGARRGMLHSVYA